MTSCSLWVKKRPRCRSTRSILAPEICAFRIPATSRVHGPESLNQRRPVRTLETPQSEAMHRSEAGSGANKIEEIKRWEEGDCRGIRNELEREVVHEARAQQKPLQPTGSTTPKMVGPTRPRLYPGAELSDKTNWIGSGKWS